MTRAEYNRLPEVKAKAAARAAKRWRESAEVRERGKLNLRKRQKEKREQLFKVVPSICALRELGPCNDRGIALHRDHDHSCSCGRVIGCKECFRGLLCDYHNRTVLPMVERWNEKFIPQLVKEHLKGRPLKGSDIIF